MPHIGSNSFPYRLSDAAMFTWLICGSAILFRWFQYQRAGQMSIHSIANVQWLGCGGSNWNQVRILVMILKDGGGVSLGISCLKRGNGLSQWIWGDRPLRPQQVTTPCNTRVAPCLVNLCWRGALSTRDLVTVWQLCLTGLGRKIIAF